MPIEYIIAGRASSLPPLAPATLLAIRSVDLREFVLDYLSHPCFIDAAQSSVQEWDKQEGSSSENQQLGTGPMVLS